MIKDKTKDVEWLADKRIIPTHGVADTGDTKTLPIDKADAFIKQGMAKEVIKTKPKTKEVN